MRNIDVGNSEYMSPKDVGDEMEQAVPSIADSSHDTSHLDIITNKGEENVTRESVEMTCESRNEPVQEGARMGNAVPSGTPVPTTRPLASEISGGKLAVASSLTSTPGASNGKKSDGRTPRARRREKVKITQISTRMRRLREAGRTGRWQDIGPIIDDMLTRKLVIDARPFTLAIKALGDSGQMKQALQLLEVGGRYCRGFPGAI